MKFIYPPLKNAQDTCVSPKAVGQLESYILPGRACVSRIQVSPIRKT